MSRRIGRRSQIKQQMFIKELPDPMNMVLWKELRKRFTVPEKGGEAYTRVDPEFGITPTLRRFGVEYVEPVENRNNIMRACATIIDKIFENVKIKYEERNTIGGTRKREARHTRFKIGNEEYYTTRKAVRAAFSYCLKNNGNVEERDILDFIQKLIEDGKVDVLTEQDLKRKYGKEAQIIPESGTSGTAKEETATAAAT